MNFGAKVDQIEGGKAAVKIRADFGFDRTR